MKKKATLLLGLILLVALGFYMLTRTADVAKAIQKTDIQKDIARFSPHENLDIAMAMKIITHDPPKMLNPPSDIPPLVLYPPSDDELKRLSGE